MDNPFTPTFGTVPLYMAGRDKILDDMKKAFRNWKNNPNITSIFIGPRGCGKTAMLSAAGDLARNEGWIVVDISAYEGMLEDIYAKITDQAEELFPTQKKAVLKEIKIKNIGLSFEPAVPESDKPGWRIRMERLADQLCETNVGLVITVDEVLPIPEMVELVSEYQIMHRRGNKISLLMAGLPKYVDDLLNDRSVSFLRRARRHMLGKVSDEEASKAIAGTMKSGGKIIEGNPLEEAVKAADGFPYMIQLVGYYIFEESGNSKKITPDEAEQGISDSIDEFENGVLYNTFADLSDTDIVFLYAMLEDRNGSRLSDIAKRMNKTNGYAYTYKVRLQRAGVIDEKNKILSFALPFFREYVEKQKAYEGF